MRGTRRRCWASTSSPSRSWSWPKPSRWRSCWECGCARGWTGLLAVGAVAMVAFAALDLRELLRQLDESDAELAVLAGTVGVLHLAAAAVATRLRAHAREGP
jgi:hypothetical protein